MLNLLLLSTIVKPIQQMLNLFVECDEYLTRKVNVSETTVLQSEYLMFTSSKFSFLDFL